MLKLVELLVRGDGWSHRAFVERLRGEHASLAADLPGLQRYTTAVPREPGRSPYDAVAELYFEDETAFGAAFDGEPGSALRADAAEFADLAASERLLVEEEVHLA